MIAHSSTIRPVVVLLAALVALSSATVSLATGLETTRESTLRIAQSNGGMTAAKAAAKAKAKYGGEVLSVERVRGADGEFYRVKILLSGGRVKVVRVVASNGDG